MVARELAAVLVCTVSSSVCVAQAQCPSTYLGDWYPSTFDPGDWGVGTSIALSADGSRVAVACPGYVQSGQATGAASVLGLVGNSVVREEFIAPPYSSTTSHFGAYALAMSGSGDTLVVGAPGSGPTTLGKAFVFRRVGGAWLLDGQFVGVATDSFGFKVALSGDGARMVVSAPNLVTGSIGQTGVVHTYSRQASGWVLESTVTGADVLNWSNGQYGVAAFGSVLALSRDGQVLAARSFASPNEPIPSGAIFMMRHTGSGWAIEKRLQEPVAYSACCFGHSLALDARGETLVAGNYADFRAGVTQAGAASIFRYGANGWQFEAALTSNDPHPNGFFGWSSALNDSGDRLLVGAVNHFHNGVMSGAVEEFVHTPNGWTFVERYRARVPELGAGFGRSVAMNATGSRWATGEPTVDLYGVNHGRLHLYEANCMEPEVFCRAQRNTLGCTPSISVQGAPSTSSPSGFVVSAARLRNQQNGMLLYGTSGRAEIPWLGGLLCVKPPLRRTPLSNSGGAPPPANNCSGSLALDFNTWTQSTSDPALFAGQHVRAQFYSRDPGAPANLNLSDAVEFYLEP